MYKHRVFSNKHNFNRRMEPDIKLINLKGGSAPVKKDVELLHIGDPRPDDIVARLSKQPEPAIKRIGTRGKGVRPLQFKF
jgi:hypothetical protein